MTTNRLELNDKVNVKVAVEGCTVGEFNGTGFHSVEEAMDAAYEAEAADYPRQDCVFTVTDVTNGTSARYRFNAHNHKALLPEERTGE